MRPCRPPRVSASSRLTRAMAIARWLLPVPVPPTSTALRWLARKVPAARSRTSPSLMGVPANSNSASSLASGSFAIVSWYLIERACFSAISALRSSPMIRCTGCWRFSPSATSSSKAARMPASCRVPIISIISWRSMGRPPQAVVSGAVRGRLMPQAQRVGGEDRQRRCRRTEPDQNVEDHIARMDALAQGGRTGGLDRRHAVGQDGGQDIDHLPVTIGGGGEPGAHAAKAAREHPVLEGSTVPERPRLAGQHGNIVPGVIDRLIATEPAGMLANDLAVLAGCDPVRIGL